MQSVCTHSDWITAIDMKILEKSRTGALMGIQQNGVSVVTKGIRDVYTKEKF
jgi:hypothetical protein